MTQFLLTLGLVIAGLLAYDLVRGPTEAEPAPGGAPASEDAIGEAPGAAAQPPAQAPSVPSIESAPGARPAIDVDRIARLEAAVDELRLTLAQVRAENEAREVSRAREAAPADPGTQGADLGGIELDQFDALMAASKERQDTREFAKAMARRLAGMPAALSADQRKRLVDLALTFRARTRSLPKDADRESIRREVDAEVGAIVESRDAQAIAELLRNASVPPAPSLGSQNLPVNSSNR